MSSQDSGVRHDMYLAQQPRGMHLQAHTRTRSLKDLYAFDDGEAREVMPLSRLVAKVSQLAFFEVVAAAERLLRRGDRDNQEILDVWQVSDINTDFHPWYIRQWWHVLWFTWMLGKHSCLASHWLIYRLRKANVYLQSVDDLNVRLSWLCAVDFQARLVLFL